MAACSNLALVEVETEEQLAHLPKLCCTEVQGFLFGRLAKGLYKLRSGASLSGLREGGRRSVLCTAILPLHSVALEDPLATLGQFRAMLLQTLLNRTVVAQLLPAKSLCVSRARPLLLRAAHMVLS